MYRLHNLTFSNYLLLNESITSAIASPVDDIIINDPNSTIRFNYKNQGYAVDFRRDEISLILWDKNNDPLIGSRISINFAGPRGYSLQNTMGAEGMNVYAELLRIIKAYLLKYPSDSIHFSAAEFDMVPIYDLFYNKFMRPDPPTGAGFLKHTPDHYISKEWIRKNKESLSSSDFWLFVTTRRKEAEEIEEIKKRKNELRKIIRSLPEYEGKFCLAYFTGVIKKITYEGGLSKTFNVNYVYHNYVTNKFQEDNFNLMNNSDFLRMKPLRQNVEDFLSILQSKLHSPEAETQQKAREIIRLIKPSEYAEYQVQPLTEAIRHWMI